MTRFLIERKANYVYKLERGMLIDEIEMEAFPYDESHAYQNKGYSEIPKSLYDEYVNDIRTEKQLKEIKQEIIKFSGIAKQMNKLWEELSQEANDILATEYPFDRGFDEIADAIQFWKETVVDE